ncbi:MAG: LysM peptidoglycan-binding domain-containing protein [Kiritimatiellia bacterium]
MRTPVVGIVVAVHCLAAVCVVLIQGCGTTTTGTAGRPLAPVMPPEPTLPEMEETETAAQPEKEPEAEVWSRQTTSYVVGPGECLSEIAGRYDLSVEAIAALNGITNPDLIREGQKLVLPGKVNVGSPAAETPSAGAPREPLPGSGVYVVKSGDCLSAIAARFGTTVRALKEANGLSSDKILVDQKLVIPGGTDKPRGATGGSTRTELPEVELDVDVEPINTIEEEPRSESSGEEHAAETRPVRSMRRHPVGQDEDLYDVAALWGVSVERLQKVNGLEGTDLEPGQIIKVPIDYR